MGGWNNRSRYVRRHRDRRPSRPPLPPPDYGQGHCSVPLWEREFCWYVGNISWPRFCENKQYVGTYNDLGHWDDSGALENFRNAKARFRAHYHGQPSDVPLPDPDMYIDRVDHRCKVDPELEADLEKVWPRFDSDNNSAASTEAAKKPSQNQSGNWDMYIENPAESNKWESDVTWGVNHETFDNWGNSNSGWGNALNNPSWRSSNNNNYSSNNWNDLHAGSKNRYQDQSNMSGRKRNSGGHFQHRNNRQRNQSEGYQRSGWQDHRGRNSEWRSARNRDRQSGQGVVGGF